MSNEKKANPKQKKESKRTKKIKHIAEQVGVDLNNDNPQIERADFVEEKSSQEHQKKEVLTNIVGIKQDEELIDKKQKVVKTIFTVLFIVFLVGSMAFTAYKDFIAPDREFLSWKELGVVLENSWKFLLFALIALFLNYFFKGLKLAIMCKSLTGKFHLKTCLETGIIGNYYNAVTPFAVGGQPFEIYHLSKHGVHGGVASSIPIAAFMLNQFAFVVLGTASLILFKNNALEIPANIYGVFPTTMKGIAIVGILGCAIMPLLVVIFSLMPRIGASLVHFVIYIGSKLGIVKQPKETTMKIIKNVIHNASCLKKICTNPLVFILCFILSFLEHVATLSLAFFVLKAFGYDAVNLTTGADVPLITEWLQTAQISLLLIASIAIIPTPGNSGAADLSFFLFFEAGLAAGLAFPATLIWRFFSFYSYIIIGFAFATIKKKADQAKETKEKEDKPPDPPPDETSPKDALQDGTPNKDCPPENEQGLESLENESIEINE